MSRNSTVHLRWKGMQNVQQTERQAGAHRNGGGSAAGQCMAATETR